MNQTPSSNLVATTLDNDVSRDFDSSNETSNASDHSVIATRTPGSISSRSGIPSSVINQPHAVEFEVRRTLTSHPSLKFSRLHVHQCRDGICLEGFLETNEDEVDLCDIVRGIEGVTNVINHVVQLRPSAIPPQKG